MVFPVISGTGDQDNFDSPLDEFLLQPEGQVIDALRAPASTDDEEEIFRRGFVFIFPVYFARPRIPDQPGFFAPIDVIGEEDSVNSLFQEFIGEPVGGVLFMDCGFDF